MQDVMRRRGSPRALLLLLDGNFGVRVFRGPTFEG